MRRPFCAWGFVIMVWGICCLRLSGKAIRKSVFPISSVSESIRMAVCGSAASGCGGRGGAFYFAVCQRGGSAGGRRRHDGRASGRRSAGGRAVGQKESVYRRSHPGCSAVWYAAGSGDAGIPEDGIADDAGAIRTDYGVRAQGKCGYAKKGMELFQCGSALCFHRKCRKNQLCSGKGSGRIPCYL